MDDDAEFAAEVAIEERKLAAALLAAGLLEDPTSTEGLIFPLPSDAVIQEIVASYDTSSTGQKIRCAVCPHHQWHFRGFRVSLQSGDHARIGIDCGEKRFGKDVWRSVSADFNRRVEIAALKSRVQPTLEALDVVIPLIEEWHRRTNGLAKWLSSFRREIPYLAERLAIVAKTRSGQLTVERRVWREGVNRHGKLFKHKDVEVELLGQVPFPSMFLGDTPTRGLNGASRELHQALNTLNGNVNGLALAKAFRSVQRARQFITDADRAHRGALANLDRGWLQGLCDWANSDDALTGSYEVIADRLTHNEHGRDEKFPWFSPHKLGSSAAPAILSVWPTSGA